MSDHDRSILSHIQLHLQAKPELKSRFMSARRTVRHFRKPAFYEMTAKCNLLCEGCYYFEGGHDPSIKEEQDVAVWGEFFRREAERGVSMAYFVGAEPALVQDRIAAAIPHFNYGQVASSGTILIDPAIPYRIELSVWAGDEQTDRELRGAPAFTKALSNYRDDRRAIFVYTITPTNIAGMGNAARLCEDNGLQLTFNLYSPTTGYLDKLQQHAQPDKKNFRISSSDNNLIFDEPTLLQVRQASDEVMEQYPDTVIYNRAYNHWITEPGPRYEIEEATGIARKCHSKVNDTFQYFTPNLEQPPVKCCMSALDCSHCRVYSAGWSTRLDPKLEDVATSEAFETWLDMMDTIQRIFFYEASAG